MIYDRGLTRGNAEISLGSVSSPSLDEKLGITPDGGHQVGGKWLADCLTFFLLLLLPAG